MIPRRSWKERLKGWRSSRVVRGVACVSIILLVGFGWIVFNSYRPRAIIKDWQQRGIVVKFSTESPDWLVQMGPQVESVVRKFIPFSRVEEIRTRSAKTFEHDANDLFTPEDIRNLERMPELETLVIKTYPVTDSDLLSIGKLTKLTELRVNCSEVSEIGISRLKELKELGDLSLDGTVNLTDIKLSQLAELPQLFRLVLKDTPITEDGLAEISRFKTLEVLDLNGSQLTGDRHRQLEQMTNIKYLYISEVSYSGIFLKEVEGRLNQRGIRVFFSSIRVDDDE